MPVSGGELGAARLRECRREQDDRYPVSGEPRQSAVKVDVHVCGVGVDLVHDDHFAGETKMTQCQVWGPHRAEKEVINGGDDEVSQHGLLASVKPRADRDICAPAVGAVELATGARLDLVPADLTG
ncbi:MAG: hypothetical protein Q605_AUC00999G0001, partial [Actinomyces urogenitalis DORA_12]